MTVNRRKREDRAVAIGVVSIVAVLLIFMWLVLRAIAALTNPHLIYNEDPGAQVFVDGQRVLSAEGTAQINPWKSSYEIEVRSARGIERRTILPWEEESDSGCIIVKKDRTVWSIETRPR